jgi:hypothetical protein
LGFVGLGLVFLWACVWLSLARYGRNHVNDFQRFLVDHNCVGRRVPVAKVGERPYIEYKCADTSDDFNLYDMPKGPGEK